MSAFDDFADELDDDDRAELDAARIRRTGKRALTPAEIAQKRAAGVNSMLKRTPQERQELALRGVAAKRAKAEARRAAGEIPEGRHNRREPSARALQPYYSMVDDEFPDTEFTPNSRRAQALLLYRRDVAARAKGGLA
jgi:hypothetical protein